MNLTEIHPDYLVDRERRGEASASDLAALDRHRSACAVCRMEHELAIESRGSPEDSMRLAHLVGAAIAEVEPLSIVAPTRARRRTRVWMLLVAAAVMVGSVAGAFGILNISAKANQERSVLGHNLASPIHAWRVEPRIVPTVIANVPTEIEPPIAVMPDAPTANETPPLIHTNTVSHTNSRVQTNAEPSAHTAGDLFSAANHARGTNAFPDAIHLYESLIAAYPRSPEAHVSLVTLGRLYAERRQDPARALTLFNQYLATDPHGSVAEVALVGKAGALRRLARLEDERAVWRRLLAEYPDSMHAETARERLGQSP